MIRKTYELINLKKLENNVRTIVNSSTNYKYHIAVVKANCYGLGIKCVKNILLGGANYLAVSSLEEARAAAIDFDGSVFFFPDLANKRIYTKQINLDGTASMNMYEYKEVPTEALNSSNFVTRQEFDETLNDIKGALNMIVQQNQQAQQSNQVEQSKTQQINF